MDELLRVCLSNGVWAAVLAVAAAVATRALRRRPAVAHILWLLVLIKLVTPSLEMVDFPDIGLWRDDTVARPESVATDERSDLSPPRDQVREAAAVPVPTRPSRAILTRTLALRTTAQGSWSWRFWMAGIWLAGALAWVWILLSSSSRFRRLIRASRPVPEALQERMNELAARLKVSRAPAISIVAARVPPLLWAPLAGVPRLLLPEELWFRFDSAQQDTVLVHELAHLKRRDHWVRRLEAVVLGIYWWNPIAWWARNRIEQSEEECCDAWVAWALPGAVESYAEAIVATVAFVPGLRQALPVGASMAGRTLPLKRRLNMIVSHETGNPMSRLVPRLLLIFGFGALPFLPALASARSELGQAEEDSIPTQIKTAPVEATAVQKPFSGVRVIQPALKFVGDRVDFMKAGRLEPINRIDVRAQAKGLIVGVYCKPAQRVKKGDLLFEIDPATYKVELKKADAEVRRAASRLKRMAAQGARLKELHELKTVGEAAIIQAGGQMEEAEAMLQEAEANRQLAQLRLDCTRVTAPIDGVVNVVIGREGEFADAGLARIISDDVLTANFYIDEGVVSYLKRLKSEGKLKSEIPVELSVRDEEGFPHRGSIDFIDVEVQPTGTVRTRAIVPNPDGLLAPGLMVRARIAVGLPHTALVVPESALGQLANGPRCVLVLDDQNIVHKRFVTPGLLYDGFRVIEKGLKADEWIVQTGPAGDLVGAKVQPERVTWP